MPRTPARKQARPAGPWRPPAWFPWALAGALAALAIVITFDPKLYINGDNVDYMFLARDIRAGHLWPSDKYPPLFPLLLAPVQALFGLRLIPQKLLVTALSFGAIWLLARIIRRRLPGKEGPWVFWVAATLIPVVEYAHYTMSEVPYLFFLLGAADACDRLLERAPAQGIRETLRQRQVWYLALWIAAAFYTRSAGVVLGGAILFVLLLARRWRGAVSLLGALVLLSLPWMLHTLSTPGGSPYVRQLLLMNPYYPEYGYLTPHWLWRRLTANAAFYFLESTPSTVFPLFYSSTYSPSEGPDFPAWVALPLLVPLILGLARRLRRADPGAAIVLFTLVLCCLWPPIWRGSRFLAPIAPLMLFFWWDGWGALRFPGRRPAPPVGRPDPRRWFRRVLLGLLVLLGLRDLGMYAVETRRYPPVWEHYFTALHWIGDHTPREAVVIDRKPGFVEFVAGRQAASFPREKDPDRMLQAFRERGASYIVLSSLPYDDIGRYLKPALDQRQSYFTILFQLADPYTYVLRFSPQEGPAPPAGAGPEAARPAPAPAPGD